MSEITALGYERARDGHPFLTFEEVVDHMSTRSIAGEDRVTLGAALFVYRTFGVAPWFEYVTPVGRADLVWARGATLYVLEVKTGHVTLAALRQVYGYVSALRGLWRPAFAVTGAVLGVGWSPEAERAAEHLHVAMLRAQPGGGWSFCDTHPDPARLAEMYAATEAQLGEAVLKARECARSPTRPRSARRGAGYVRSNGRRPEVLTGARGLTAAVGHRAVTLATIAAAAFALGAVAGWWLARYAHRRRLARLPRHELFATLWPVPIDGHARPYDLPYDWAKGEAL